MLIETAAALELLLFACARTRHKREQRRQALMGNRCSIHLPVVDGYLKRQTVGASRAEVFAASQLAAVCRKAVQTQSFQSLLLHGIRSARRGKRISIWRIAL